ncbi:hypothetical protein [Paludisphaera soli]|uniref:hypothetical protein n=1 Tax=Paludisphaera soli TaxID=2712865 RepID=UPI0013EA1D63|nr:hypothetical protein [Paludisphaera soli]
MDGQEFASRLRLAADASVVFAREFVRETLPDETAFLVFPNQSCDGHPLVGDETIYPQDSLPDGLHMDGGRHHGPWTAGEVVDFLWRDEKVPEWIDVMVEDEDGRRTLVSLRCCGRFTAQEDLLYYRGRETRPFAVKSPYFPPHWESVEASGRFSVRYWKDRRIRPA